ncbi:hypothetical protein, partial [Staphylococcus epidermidis]|uniref:hypothetical protein n=1 Tax=Staphylococcus epidermidis TaxID=1282 RepID=UPI0011A8CB57
MVNKCKESDNCMNEVEEIVKNENRVKENSDLINEDWREEDGYNDGIEGGKDLISGDGSMMDKNEIDEGIENMKEGVN